jgi:hypothetical protein
MRRLAVLVLLLLAGCGGGAPSEVVPADATYYIGTSADETDRLLYFIARDDLDFDRDVKPWLGDRAAYFRRDAEDDFGLVFASDDDERAEAFGRKVAVNGPLRAAAIVDGYLVATSSRELLRIVQASGGRSLADSAHLDVGGEDGDDAPDVLMTAEDTAVLVSRFQWSDVIPRSAIPATALGDDQLAVRMWSEPRRQRIEVSGLPSRPDTAPSLADVPGAARLAFASPDLGEDLALLRAHEQFIQIGQATGIDLEQAVLPHLGAGMFFVQGRDPLEMGGRLVAETVDEEALRREATAWAKRLGPKRGEIHAGEGFFELTVDHPDLPHLFLEIRDGRLQLDGGVAPGGVAEDLDDTPAYRDAARLLGGPPTFLLTEAGGYLAARDAVEDGRRVVQGVSVQQRG